MKALSNQKYREFQETFGDVGLITGDVVINPSASCLVMTTEILRSMLYKGSTVVREASLVVYDEIHYLRDKERGVVWEESIILAPRSARFAFLSATIPNAREFAEWIATTHNSPCHVVYTDYRPTPLQHFLFPSGGDGLYLVVDERSVFREDAFSKAVAALNDAESKAASLGRDNKKTGGKDEPSDVFKIVDMIIQRNYDPVIVFSFSKNECDALADQLSSLDLTDKEEKKLVDAIYDNAIAILSAEDRKLKDVVDIVARLRRGIGVHHSGMLPILKELTEILFQEGLLKVLFATETFSTGLNMPARTVVFTHARKFDGGKFRWVTSGEYIQMSGRAGRRGLDDKGVVMLMLDAKMDPATAKNMLRGAPDTLHSEFHLTYSMILNMLRMEGAKPEELMARSYRQFQAQRLIPSLEAKLSAKEKERDDIAIEEEEDVERFAGLRLQHVKISEGLRVLLMKPKYVMPFLQPGRLVKVLSHASRVSSESFCEEMGDGAWGAVVSYQMVPSKKDGHGDAESDGGNKGKKSIIVDILVNCLGGSSGSDVGKGRDGRIPVPASYQPPSTTVAMNTNKGTIPSNAVVAPQVISRTLDDLSMLSALRIHLPKDLRTTQSRNVGLKVLAEVEKRFDSKGGPPILSPKDDMNVVEEDYEKLAGRLSSLQSMLASHPLAGSPTLHDRLIQLQKKQAIAEDVRNLRKEIKATAGLILHEDLKYRQRVLKRLDFIDTDGLVTKKGRTAAEISSGDELVLCDLIYNGVFGPLTPEFIAALVSCFIWREKADIKGKVPKDMEGSYAALRDAARRVGKAERDCNLPIDIDEYVESFKPDLIDITIAWCRGATFSHIMSLAGKKTHGGSLVRALRRLEELLRQLAAALRSVGDVLLAEKFEAAIEKLKRDVVFAASLFL